jgi:hypothetical protein
VSFKDIALPLAKRDIPVIPVQPFGKDTYLPGGEERGSLLDKDILAWDRENSEYNVGCLGTAYGVTILDCDVPGLMTRIEQETGQKCPATFTVKSAGKGCAHFYFRQTDASRRLGNKKGDGLFDLRGNNHYVVGPGSALKLSDGTIRKYAIWRDAPIAEFPEWLEPWILANSSSAKGGATGDVDQDSYRRLRKAYLDNLRPDDMLGLPDLTIESLHPTLHSLACLLHDGQRTEDDVVGLLERIAESYGHRMARGRNELEGIVEHAFKKQPTEFTLPDNHPSLTAFSDGLVVFATEEALRDHLKNSWRALFHTRHEAETAPPITFAIDKFLQDDGITMLGALPGHNKTNVALAMVRALLEGSPLFGYFGVPRPSSRVVYLIPESGLTPFVSRLKTFKLMPYIGESLFFRTFSAKDDEILKLDDQRLRAACEGADVFLDTAVRFMDGDENAVMDQKIFARNLFTLLRTGARTVTGLHHAPKSFEKLDYMSLENILRGSGDLGAMLCACWGLRQVDNQRNRVFIENVKARDFLPCEPFIIEGRPHLDVDGYFKMTDSPGIAGSLNQNKPKREGSRPAGRPEDPDKAQKMTRIRELHANGRGSREIAAEVGVSYKTVLRWLTDEGKNAEPDEGAQSL